MRSWRWTLGAALVLGACGARGPMLHQMEPDALYTRATEKLEARDWDEAIRAFDQFILRFPGDGRVEEARFRLGNAYFGKKDYVTAASEFVRLATDYPTGPLADDARYRTCEAYYELSPKPQLDQEFTRAAIDHCQELVTHFPTSEYAPRAQEQIQNLVDKLAEKTFRNGEYYYKRRALDSSIIYYEALLERFPESSYSPRALLRLVQIYNQLAYDEEMQAARDRLLREFPGSDEAKQAEAISPASGK